MGDNVGFSFGLSGEFAIWWWVGLALLILIAVVIVFYIIKAVFQIKKDRRIASSHPKAKLSTKKKKK